MTEILAVDALHPEPAAIARAAELLRHGEVIAIPTDTFYGLAANPFDTRAVEKVFAIKGRPKNNPLLLLVDSIEMATAVSPELPPEFYALARRFWPGPLTMVVKASGSLPPAVTAHTGTIGLRLPSAPVATALARAAGFPITATSANRSGQPDCASAQEVKTALGDRLSLILDGGPSHASKPSTVLVLIEGKWKIVREGIISGAAIAAFFDTPALGMNP